MHNNTATQIKMKKKALISDSHHVDQQKKLKESDQPTQLRRTCHSLPSPSNTRLTWQPHICQVSCISWHSRSRAMWQLSATFANSQSCRKREILSPGPCTCNASCSCCLYETRWKTHFRLPTKLRLHSPPWTLWGVRLPFFPGRDLKTIPNSIFPLNVIFSLIFSFSLFCLLF